MPCCPVCGEAAKPDSRAHSELALEQAPKTFSVFRCTGCGLRWLSPPPSAEDFQDIYDDDYYKSLHAGNLSFDKKKQTLTALYKEIIRQFTAFGVHENILDVGCGRGEFLAVASQAGIKAEGIEPSIYASQVAKKLDVPIWNGTLIDFPVPESAYAGVYCGHVLEHVADAHEFMRKLESVLEPNGLLYIEVPVQFDGVLDIINRLRMKRYDFTDYSIHHHYFFTAKAMRQLLEAHNFEILSLTTFLPWRRASRKPGLRKWSLQLLLWAADRLAHRGDVISVWARRGK